MKGGQGHSAGHSKAEGKKTALGLRARGIFATAIKDDRAKRGEQYIVLVPKNIKLTFCATGPGGGKDPTCSPKAMKANELSEKANGEKNVLAAAKLHARAANAH